MGWHNPGSPANQLDSPAERGFQEASDSRWSGPLCVALAAGCGGRVGEKCHTPGMEFVRLSGNGQGGWSILSRATGSACSSSRFWKRV